MTDVEFFRMIGPLSFRAADKFFKFTSWAIIISVVRYAKTATGSTALEWVDLLATSLFSFALLMQAYYLFVRSPSDWGIPQQFHIASRVLQAILAALLLFVCTAPFLFLDTILADLQNAKPHEIIAKPD